MRGKTRGFTLTETLVTVALIGMFTGLTLSALGPLNLRFRRRQAAELVAAAAARARIVARDSGRCLLLEVYQDDTPVSVGTPGNRVRVARRVSADCESVAAAGDVELVEWVPMPQLATVRVASETTPVWRPTGRLYSEDGAKTPARLQVSSGGEELSILLAAHGPVCVKDKDDPLPEECP